VKFLLLADTHAKNQTPIAELAAGCTAILILGDTHPDDFIGLERVSIPKIGVHGNWDAIGPGKAEWFDTLGIENAHLKVCEVGGMRIGGFDGNMKYSFAELHTGTANPAWEEARRELDELAERFPPVDIFIAHYPVAGSRDDPSNASHRGLAAFRRYIERTQPKYHFHGHLHENRVETIGSTQSQCVYPSAVVEL
jgi:Icc-related predicted phosphoesterase